MLTTRMRFLGNGAFAAAFVLLTGCDAIWGLKRAELYTSDGGTGGGSGGGGAIPCTPGQVVTCYSGPSTTEGIGVCKAGLKECSANGTYGPCMGEVTPLPEDCSTPQDDDCDGLAPTCKGTLMWAKHFGDANDQHPTAVAVDSQGNVIVAGYFEGEAAFGTTPLVSTGGRDAFLVKFNASGTHLWSRRFGDADDQIATGVAVDPTDNIVLVGDFSGSIDFGGGALVAQKPPGIITTDVFVAKFAPDSTPLWSSQYGDANNQSVSGVAIDSESNIVVTGAFAGEVDFGGEALVSAGGTDIFVARFDKLGALLWSARFGDAANQVARGVAFDSSNNAFLAGTFDGMLDFGTGAITSAGGTDAFIAKLAASNTFEWFTRGGDKSDQSVAAVAADSAGNVIVAGAFAGSVGFGASPLMSAGAQDIFVAKLADSSIPSWSGRYGDASDQVATAVGVDHQGSVLVAGNFSGAVNFGGDTLASLGGTDVFVTKLDSGGNHSWSKRFGNGDDQEASAAAFDSNGNGIVVGSFRGAVDFGGGLLTSAGGRDIFVAKFAP